MKIKTGELTGSALDWAVLKCVKFPMIGAQGFVLRDPDGDDDDMRLCQPSINWLDGGPIIEREKITVGVADGDDVGWTAWARCSDQKYWACGPTPLIAAMRCYVASKLGDEVGVPKKLT